jgi:hypothetical protein
MLNISEKNKAKLNKNIKYMDNIKSPSDDFEDNNIIGFIQTMIQLIIIAYYQLAFFVNIAEGDKKKITEQTGPERMDHFFTSVSVRLYRKIRCSPLTWLFSWTSVRCRSYSVSRKR